jgi:hypothetical protein
MSSLLHHSPAYRDITDEEAVSYIHDTGPWSRFLVTPWPVQSLVEGVVVLGVGGWATIAVAMHSVVAAVGVAVLTLLVALLVAAPGAYTETHRDYAERYYAAVRVHGDYDVRAHPYALLLASPFLCALVGAFGGLHSGHESTGTRIYWAIGGAVFGLVYALLRIRQARRTPVD